MITGNRRYLVDITSYIGVGISFLGLSGGLVSYIVHLRIRHDILENNDKLEKDIAVIKEKVSASINSLRDELTREFGNSHDKMEKKLEKVEDALGDLTANISDRILNVVNGKYVRTDLHQQTLSGIQERFVSLRELIEVNMVRIEQGLDRQIVDLKDRIFNSGSSK